MEDIKNRVEAVLFTTGRFLTLEEISLLTGISQLDLIKEALEKLIQEYNAKETSLEIIKQGMQYKLGLKKDYMHLTTKLLSTTELEKPVQETLALIAYKQPVLQSLIVKMRGNRAYEHITKLKDLDFITSEKFGRTKKLNVTSKFYDYFDIVYDKLKEKFKEVELKNEN